MSDNTAHTLYVRNKYATVLDERKGWRLSEWWGRDFDRWLAKMLATAKREGAVEALEAVADELEAMVGGGGPGNRSTGYGQGGLDVIRQVRARAAHLREEQ